MKETLFALNGGTYAQQGDYLFPDIKLHDESEHEIGVWGNRRRQFLKQHHRVKYYNMLPNITKKGWSLMKMNRVWRVHAS